MHKQGFSLRKIAEDLSRSPSTISREVKRNSGGRGYRFAQAQRKARQRGTAASSVPRKMTERMWSIVEEKLSFQWSPDQISGRLKLDAVVLVSAEWIYRHVWEDKRNGGKLYKHLRRRGKKRNSRGSRYSGRGHIRQAPSRCLDNPVLGNIIFSLDGEHHLLLKVLHFRVDKRREYLLIIANYEHKKSDGTIFVV